MKVQSTAPTAQTSHHAASKHVKPSGEENAGLFSIQINNILSRDNKPGISRRDAYRETPEREDMEESANPPESVPDGSKSRNTPVTAEEKKTSLSGTKQTGSGEVINETGVGTKKESAVPASGIPREALNAHQDDSSFSLPTGEEVPENEIPRFSIPETGDLRSKKSDLRTVIADDDGMRETTECPNEETPGTDSGKGGVFNKKQSRFPVGKPILSAGSQEESKESNLKAASHEDRETNPRFAMSISHTNLPESGFGPLTAVNPDAETQTEADRKNAGGEDIRRGVLSPETGGYENIGKTGDNSTGKTDSGEAKGGSTVSARPEPDAQYLSRSESIDESGQIPSSDKSGDTYPAMDEDPKTRMKADGTLRPNNAGAGRSKVAVHWDPEDDTVRSPESTASSSGKIFENSGSTKKTEGSQETHSNAGTTDAVDAAAQNGKDFRASAGIAVNRDLHTGNKSDTNNTPAHAKSDSGSTPDIKVTSTGADSGSDGAKQDGKSGGQNDFPRFNIETTHAKEGIPSPVKHADAATDTTQSGIVSVLNGASHKGSEAGSPVMHNPGKSSVPFSDPFTPQIAEKIQFLVRDGEGVLRIRLQPDEFGEMEIRAETTSKGLVARIAAESASVKNYLENNLHALQQHLQDQGMKVDRIQVILQDESDFQSASNHSSKSGHSNSGQNSPNRSLYEFGDKEKSAAADSTDSQFYYQEKRFHTVA